MNWTKQEILFRLRETGTTAAALAEKAGCSRQNFYGALERPYPKVQAIVAEALGVSRQQIWPEFYDEAGQRRRLAATSALRRAA